MRYWPLFYLQPVSSGPGVGPAPTPIGRRVYQSATSFSVIIDRLSTTASINHLQLQVRQNSSGNAWVAFADVTSPSLGILLTATGLTTMVAYDWRLVEIAPGGGVAEGSYGIVIPRKLLVRDTVKECFETPVPARTFGPDGSCSAPDMWGQLP